MPRLIDADELMARVLKKKSGIATERYTEGWNDAIEKFRSMIHGAPTIDAEPVRHGRWLHNSDYPDNNVCSVCSARFDMWWHERIGHSYCAKCGAKMDAKEDE